MLPVEKRKKSNQRAESPDADPILGPCSAHIEPKRTNEENALDEDGPQQLGGKLELLDDRPDLVALSVMLIQVWTLLVQRI